MAEHWRLADAEAACRASHRDQPMKANVLKPAFTPHLRKITLVLRPPMNDGAIGPDTHAPHSAGRAFDIMVMGADQAWGLGVDHDNLHLA